MQEQTYGMGCDTIHLISSQCHQHDLKSVRKVIHSCFKVFMSFHKFKVFALLVKQKLTSNLNLLRSFETDLNNMLAQGTLSPWQPNHFTPQVFTL